MDVIDERGIEPQEADLGSAPELRHAHGSNAPRHPNEAPQNHSRASPNPRQVVLRACASALLYTALTFSAMGTSFVKCVHVNHDQLSTAT
jgi:hypothetical protein